MASRRAPPLQRRRPVSPLSLAPGLNSALRGLDQRAFGLAGDRSPEEPAALGKAPRNRGVKDGDQLAGRPGATVARRRSDRDSAVSRSPPGASRLARAPSRLGQPDQPLTPQRIEGPLQRLRPVPRGLRLTRVILQRAGNRRTSSAPSPLLQLALGEGLPPPPWPAPPAHQLGGGAALERRGSSSRPSRADSKRARRASTWAALPQRELRLLPAPVGRGLHPRRSPPGEHVERAITWAWRDLLPPQSARSG